MRGLPETLDGGTEGGVDDHHGPPVPGLVAVFSAGRPLLECLPLRDAELIIGRGGLPPTLEHDQRMSRRHASVAYDGVRWLIEDFGSRNGTFLDGQRVTGKVESTDGRVLRAGDTVFLLHPNMRAFEGAAVDVSNGTIVGPALRPAWKAIAAAAAHGRILHITGETGTGKELAARHFHLASPVAGGPFVAVNCATLAPNLAERLLFGARRGAYSGADSDSQGLIQAAQRGTLFLDEIGDLDSAVQAKLLRVLETGEVLPLGASVAQRVDFRLCSATHADLAQRVQSGAFREDLYFRIAGPTVALPPLRARLADAPWIVAHILQAHRRSADASLIEAVLTRPWPGNIRELAAELRQAAQVSERSVVPGKQLSSTAGTSRTSPSERPPSTESEAQREEVRRALAHHGGNVSAAARTLKMHRTQLRRIIERLGLDPRSSSR
jgi:transcriptional regulator with PAS, ATPase and Fis domain